MQLELSFSNEKPVLPGVRALTKETLHQLPILSSDCQHLEEFIFAAVCETVEHAYPPGETGSIQLLIKEEHGKLEIRLRDYGMPCDIPQLERELSSSGNRGISLFGCHLMGVVDEAHWLGFGPQGKALQIIKWMNSQHIADRQDSDTLKSFQEDAPLARDQNYVIRRLKAEEAVFVSRLMYRGYGNTYFNADVYYPERIAAQNAKGSLVSIIAQAEDGEIVGHCALEFNREGPIAESGQAVVDPAHRGRGLLERMKEVLLQEANKRDLVGWFGNAVAVHTLTQQSHIRHGGHLTAVLLGISPKSEVFRNMAEKLQDRVTCLCYFHWLKPPGPRTVFVPARHQEMVAKIYQNLACQVQFGSGQDPRGHGMIAIELDNGAAKANLRVDQIGEDTFHTILQAKRNLLEKSHVEVLYVELPLTDPATAFLHETLEEEGFGFLGLVPCCSHRGDVLLLGYLVDPLTRNTIKTAEGFAEQLVDYTLQEQVRVQNQ